MQEYQEIIVVGAFFLPFIVLGIMLAMQKKDTTTPEEIAEATRNLEQEISKAEEIVGRLAPHSKDCRDLLANARYCLTFSGRSTRLVVSAAMIKNKRLEGIDYARQAAKLAQGNKKA